MSDALTPGGHPMTVLRSMRRDAWRFVRFAAVGVAALVIVAILLAAFAIAMVTG